MEGKKFKNDRSNQTPSKEYAKTEGIEPSEIQLQNETSEYRRFAWPSDMKGNHWVKDCVRQIQLDIGTAYYAKAKEYQKMKVAGVDESSSTDDISSSDSEDSSLVSRDETFGEENSESEYWEYEEGEQQDEETERNWGDSSSGSE